MSTWNEGIKAQLPGRVTRGGGGLPGNLPDLTVLGPSPGCSGIPTYALLVPWCTLPSQALILPPVHFPPSPEETVPALLEIEVFNA